MSAFWMQGSGILAQMLMTEVKKALEQVNGNREAAAKLLGISERTMYRIVKSLRIRAVEFDVCPRCKGNGRVLRKRVKRLVEPDHCQA